ncbi:MAG: hypothetical protein ACREM1_11525 [Longimicrobiales bacterium]
MFEPPALTMTGTLMYREPAAPLERSFAAFDEAPDVPAALSSEEHRRLTHNMEALLEQVRQLADFLANDREASDG